MSLQTARAEIWISNYWYIDQSNKTNYHISVYSDRFTVGHSVIDLHIDYSFSRVLCKWATCTLQPGKQEQHLTQHLLQQTCLMWPCCRLKSKTNSKMMKKNILLLLIVFVLDYFSKTKQHGQRAHYWSCIIVTLITINCLNVSLCARSSFGGQTAGSEMSHTSTTSPQPVNTLRNQGVTSPICPLLSINTVTDPDNNTSLSAQVHYVFHKTLFGLINPFHSPT